MLWASSSTSGVEGWTLSAAAEAEGAIGGGGRSWGFACAPPLGPRIRRRRSGGRRRLGRGGRRLLVFREARRGGCFRPGHRGLGARFTVSSPSGVSGRRF